MVSFESVAVAFNVTEAGATTMALLAGAVSETTGGASTLMVAGAVTAISPRLS